MFETTTSFDECGFQASHEDGVLVFSNKVSSEPGNNFGLLFGPIPAFSFDISCKFHDVRNFLKQVKKQFSNDLVQKV